MPLFCVPGHDHLTTNSEGLYPMSLRPGTRNLLSGSNRDRLFPALPVLILAALVALVVLAGCDTGGGIPQPTATPRPTDTAVTELPTPTSESLLATDTPETNVPESTSTTESVFETPTS